MDLRCVERVEKDFVMASLVTGKSICLFGAYSVRLDGKPYHLGISGPTEKLFQYLLINQGVEIRREFLADLFWRASSPDRQKSALNSAIWRIKRQLTEIGDINLICKGHKVLLQVSTGARVDARELSDIVHSIPLDEPMNVQLAERLYRILDNCNSPFMDGVMDDWVLAERERLFNIQNRGMIILMHWLGQQRRYEDALEIGRRLLAADPSREAAQCEVMLLYVVNGQRAQALRHYQEFRMWLNQELDIEPMPETRALHDYIRMDINTDKYQKPSRPVKPQTAESKTPSFSKLLGAIDRSRHELYEVLSNQLL